MKSDRLYEAFLEALSDDEVKALVIQSVERKTADRLEGQTELFPHDDALMLSAENDALQRQLAVCEIDNSRLKSRLADMRSELFRLKSDLDYYRDIYGPQISLYKKYMGLSSGTAAAVHGFFKNNSPAGLFMCGIRLDNLRGLRDFAERLVIENADEKKDDAAILNDLYAGLLAAYNSTFANPVYRIIDVSPGDTFDERIHHNIGTVKSGVISVVYLCGCETVANGKIVRKAIVRI